MGRGADVRELLTSWRNFMAAGAVGFGGSVRCCALAEYFASYGIRMFRSTAAALLMFVRARSRAITAEFCGLK